MLNVELAMATGQTYVLTGSPLTEPVLAPEGNLRELRGVASRSDLSRPGRPGVLPGKRRFGAIEQEITFYLRAQNGEEMERVYREFRRGWDGVCTFKVEADHPQGAFFLDVVAGVLPGVDVDARRRTQMNLAVPVFNSTGLFRSGARTSLTVANVGDATVFPRIVNTGSGGTVRGPSGASWSLPASSVAPLVDLAPEKLMIDGAFPEGVEPGETGTWSLPDGAQLVWELLVANPWG
ncbi:hypothetical protein J7S19_01785 [Corynebacterium pyruviciproducens]|uniref:hypothetical protein n=1 Tax=Corynebacterium pyruviciproducens TaxID=598660 RepID=UPI002455D7E7|nr:hypothetical protein [Corynebacterium pyruviciproducens]MDH4657358.1 hypothetical protein [Corynebacterium pyruviciproducens]